MSQKKEDRRIKMTKYLLRESLIDLLEEKSMFKITIKEICQKADVNRSTFYAHFSDPHQLLESIEEEYVDKILHDINPDMMDTDKAYPLVTDILEFIYKNEKMSRILLSDRGDLHFQKKIMKLVHDNVLNQMKDNQPIDLDKAGLVSSFVISGCIGIIQNWFENDLKSSPEEIGKIISDLTTSALTFI